MQKLSLSAGFPIGVKSFAPGGGNFKRGDPYDRKSFCPLGGCIRARHLSPNAAGCFANQPRECNGDHRTVHKFGEGSTVLAEKLNFLPDISDPGQYQGAFALGTITKLGEWLGWQNQFSDIYVSNPPIGTKEERSDSDDWAEFFVYALRGWCGNLQGGLHS